MQQKNDSIKEIDPPMIVRGMALLKDLVDVRPPALHYFAAVMDTGKGNEFVIFDQVQLGSGKAHNIFGDSELSGYIALSVPLPITPVFTVRPAHARYTFGYGDFDEDGYLIGLDTVVIDMRYVEAIDRALGLISLCCKVNTCTEMKMEIGDWRLQFFDRYRNNLLTTRKFWIREDNILNENAQEPHK